MATVATRTSNSIAGTSSANGGNPVEAARRRTSYRNNWGRKQVDLSMQHTWQHPMPDDPLVAIIGGGIAGLACAQALAQQGIRSVVFDTGEHGVGGRLATRTTADASIHANWLATTKQPGGSRDAAAQQMAQAGLVFDHAAQYFTATDERFKAVVQQWEAEGAVQQWRGPVGVLSGGTFTPLEDGGPKYVAKGGMRKLAQHLAAKGAALRNLVEVRRPQWVARMAVAQEGGTPGCGGWRLTGNNRNQGTFDFVVIAHNGKCANRLVGPTGAPLVAQQLMRLRLSAVWALMVAFEGPVEVPGGMEGAFMQGDSTLSWAANNSAKLQLTHPGHPTLSCWTLLSTDAFAQANKVPQEAIPADVAGHIALQMLAAFSAALGKPLPQPVFTRAQLWGAALPLNSPRVGSIFDPRSRVGACGDFCLGSGIDSAVLSGMDMAQRIAGLRGAPAGAANAAALDALAYGLTEEFTPLRESGIGEVAGAPKQQQVVKGAGGRRQGGNAGGSKRGTAAAGGAGASGQASQRSNGRPAGRSDSNGTGGRAGASSRGSEASSSKASRAVGSEAALRPEPAGAAAGRGTELRPSPVRVNASGA